MRAFGPRFKQAVTNLLALPSDAILDVSRLTCVDGSEVVVENVVALIHVGQKEIQLDLGNMVLHLVGDDFEVTLVAGNEVHMRGQVTEVRYIRQGGNPA
ncbi:hypothetical protein LLE49_01070 [Alicyclobacillus tolerans]|uniref:YabP/YqfC family sporulation protein n=1 Tax=Alicyclobacillus tolerans TaxID=90970 RepID=UPI001F43D372|nr:YabP/YqfC family sporulation protein [Alicyclobacillus tolerans]MCF8563335.1 hypothetical protein [Alicyclobacillus tolerans]